MLRCLRLQALDVMLRRAACLSSPPSTSQPEAVDFGTNDGDSHSIQQELEQSSSMSMKTLKVVPPSPSSVEKQLRETKAKIKRWKEKKLPEVEVDSESNLFRDSVALLNSEEWQRYIDSEESLYNERANSFVETLKNVHENDESTSSIPQTQTSTAESSSDDLILAKRKLGQVKFRKIIYSEGELDKSNLSQPPSRDNPHPFDPEKHSPPVFTRSLVPLVNYTPYLQALVDLGVNLFEVDCTSNLAKYLLRLNTEKDVKPKLQWLVSIGMEPDDLGDYLTRNPHFLIQNLDDMKARVNYMESKKFKPEQIVKIVKEFRYWLNVDVKTMDARLGWLQKQFQLSGNEVRALIVKEPRVIMFGLGPLQRFVVMFNKELEFTPSETKKMLLNDPRLFMMDPKYVAGNYHYVHQVMRLPNFVIASNPFILRCSLSSLRNRHEFLRKLGRAHYESQLPSTNSKGENEVVETVALEDLLHPSDSEFCKRAANSFLVAFDKFLRSH